MHPGNRTAAESLLQLVYDELRKLAALRIAQERPGQTFDATAWSIRPICGWSKLLREHLLADRWREVKQFAGHERQQ